MFMFYLTFASKKTKVIDTLIKNVHLLCGQRLCLIHL